MSPSSTLSPAASPVRRDSSSRKGRASSGSALQGDWIAASLSDPAKRKAAAQILGQAYITALCCIRHNREAVARIAEVLVQKKELYGDEVVDLLKESDLEAPVIDVLDESIWPKL